MRVEGPWKGVGWVAVALLMSFGVGGMVAGADHPAGDETRPELTGRADAVVAPRLAAMATALEKLEERVVALGRSGREALVHLTARRLDRFVSELDRGGRVLAGIEADLTDLRGRYEQLPYGPDSDRIGERTRERLTLVREAIETLPPVPRSWNALSLGSVPAVELARLLERHDAQVFQATRAGTAGYSNALVRLRRAIRALDRAVVVRDTLSTTADVSTLDEWLRRARVYDEALLRLYTILQASDGGMTDEARRALRSVDRAHAALPADTESLVILMADIAQGGLNQAVVDIERARGSLSEALASLRYEGTEPPAGPTMAP